MQLCICSTILPKQDLAAQQPQRYQAERCWPWTASKPPSNSGRESIPAANERGHLLTQKQPCCCAQMISAGCKPSCSRVRGALNAADGETEALASATTPG